MSDMKLTDERVRELRDALAMFKDPDSSIMMKLCDHWLATNASRPQPEEAATGGGVEHFPATSEPERCCYRYTNGERCELRRDTHSFCISHAKQIQRALSAGEK